MNKKLITVTLAGALVLGSGAVAFAAPGKGADFTPPGQLKKATEQVEKAGGQAVIKDEHLDKVTVIDGKRVKVKGNHVKFDVPPVIKEGRTLIPVRAITEGLGAKVEWDAETSTITITKGDAVIVLVLGSNEVYVNGDLVIIDVPAGLINNRTFVPIRFIAQTLGEKVKYNEENGEIEIGDGVEVDEAVEAEAEVGAELEVEVEVEVDEAVEVEVALELQAIIDAANDAIGTAEGAQENYILAGGLAEDQVYLDATAAIAVLEEAILAENKADIESATVALQNTVEVLDEETAELEPAPTQITLE
jgi:hypothetical protein